MIYKNRSLKADGWIIDDSYKFVKGPTKLIISRCETKE